MRIVIRLDKKLIKSKDQLPESTYQRVVPTVIGEQSLHKTLNEISVSMITLLLNIKLTIDLVK